MRGMPVQLPDCGLFLGTGVYATSGDYLLSTLYAQTNSPQEMIDKIVADNQGNLAQFWGYARGYAPATHAKWFYALDEIGIEIPPPDWEKSTNIRVQDCEILKQHDDRRGAGIVRFIKAAAEKGIYTALIYTDAHPQWSAQLKDMGAYYLGYDFGERFTIRFEESAITGQRQDELTLADLAHDLVARVREHVDQRHAAGWGNVMATGGNFYIDYEIVAGTDIPVFEDFCFNLNLSSALSRGLYRQHDLPLWGSHLAHEHYSWIPNSHPHKFDLLRMAMYLKYMAGCKMIINESGNWFVEASLCEDSPKHEFPRVPLKPAQVSFGGHVPVDFSSYIPEARKHFAKVGYDSPICRQYRKITSDFYDFVKTHGTPAGQPETTIAMIKGNYDLCGTRYSPDTAVGGAFKLADRNPAWFEGAPERGWKIAEKVFHPLPSVLEPCPNLFLSGTPFGMIDIVSFALDEIDAGFLSSQYKALLFTGWNTASQKQYEILKNYVANGGTLFISIPHLSTNIRRNFSSYSVDELINKGDFSELCGVKVKARGRRYYWATAPDGSDELGFRFPRRFGIIGACMGDIEITDPAAKILVVDDEQAAPILIKRKLGKGTVFFLNSWAYPGAINTDEGPGARTNSNGLIGTIYRHIAQLSRGDVWITDDRNAPGHECEFVAFSHFPEANKICLLNIDANQPHRVFLHRFGQYTSVQLSPGEFRLTDARQQETPSLIHTISR